MGYNSKIYSQVSFDWISPQFEGIPIDWHILFEDTLGADTSISWPFIEDKYFQYGTDILQHSDGDIVFLNQTKGIPAGYVLLKVDSKTGQEKWTQILREETVGHRLGGLQLFETPTGDIEVIGVNYLAPSNLPAFFGSAFRSLHSKRDGIALKVTNPESTKAIISSEGDLLMTPVYSLDNYLLVEGISNGFRIQRVEPSFEKQDLKTISTLKDFERNGNIISGNTSFVKNIIPLPDGNYVFNYSLNSEVFSVLESGVINLIVWMNPEGEILNIVDITEELGFAQSFDIKYSHNGILAYTSTGLEKIGNQNRYTAHSALIDYSGTILWGKELFTATETSFGLSFNAKIDGNGFICTAREASEHKLRLFDFDLNGNIVGEGELASKIPHHKLEHLLTFITKENDLIIWSFINADTIVGSTNLLEYQARAYGLKVSAKNLSLSSSSNESVSKNKILTIFPNPAIEIINISIANGESLTGQVKFINSLGQTELIQKLDRQSSDFAIDVSNLSNGIYRLQVWNDDQLIETQSISVLRN